MRSSSVAPAAAIQHPTHAPPPPPPNPPRHNWWKARRSDSQSPQGQKLKRNVTVVARSSTIPAAHVVTIGLQSDETLAFYGIVSLSVLAGQVSINHCRFDADSGPQQLYCSQTDPLPIIHAVQPRRPLRPSNAASAGLEASHFAAVLQVTTITDTGLEDLPLVCPLAGPEAFGASPSSAVTRKWGSARKAEAQIHVPFFHTVSQASGIYDAPNSWQKALEEAASSAQQPDAPSVVSLIRGPKSVGKSTFARSLLNVLGQSSSSSSSNVAFLDLDLGQPEFNVPGTVSLYSFSPSTTMTRFPLISPSWLTHSAVPSSVQRQSHYLGQTTPKDIPSTYLAAVEALVSHWRSQSSTTTRRRGQTASSPPFTPTHLIVNTMGWTKGLGSELGARVEALLRPDVIYDLHAMNSYGGAISAAALPRASMTQEYRDAYGGVSHPGSRVVPLHGYSSTASGLESSSTASQSQLPPADRRTLSIMTALHSSSASTAHWDFRTPLLEQKPLVVDIQTANLTMAYVPASRTSLGHTSHRIMALNGELVALCSGADDPTLASSSETDHMTSDSSSAQPAWQEHFFSRNAAPLPAFHNLAIVRHIDDSSSHRLQLLVPRSSILDLVHIPTPTLRVSNPSISPTLSLPIWAYLDAQAVRRAMRGWPAVLPDADNVDTNTAAEYTDTLAGVPFSQVPFLDFPDQQTKQPPQHQHPSASSFTTQSPQVIGGQRRRVRRNLMRKNQA